MPSLEQIANEVLVDMTDPQDQGQTALERNLHLFQTADTAPMTTGSPPQPDESVDSAISLPASEAPKENGLTNGHAIPQEEAPQLSTEPSEAKAQQHDGRPQSSASKSGVEGLPLYQPPAPISQSPELSKRQPALTNGASPATDTNGVKRKRESVSSTPGAKKSQMNFAGGPESAIAEEGGDRESRELAKMLQQEDRGLRRRS